MTNPPLMRSSYINDNLKSFATLPADVQERVRAIVKPEIFERISSSTRVDWLPLELDIEVTEACYNVLGVAQGREWSKQTFLASATGPLLKPVVSAAVAVLGLNPRSIWKFFHVGWKQIYKDCGLPRFEDMPGNVGVRMIVEQPPEIMKRGHYLEGIAGTLDAVPVLVNTTGRVEVTPESYAPGAPIILTSTWA